jgi:hypothetical protein
MRKLLGLDEINPTTPPEQESAEDTAATDQE